MLSASVDCTRRKEICVTFQDSFVLEILLELAAQAFLFVLLPIRPRIEQETVQCCSLYEKLL